MSHSGATLSTYWQFYLVRSEEADRKPLDHWGLAREEQLNEILFGAETHKECSRSVQQRFDRIPWNRAKKHFRLNRMLSVLSRCAENLHSPQIDEFIANEELLSIRQEFSDEEWQIEIELANGATYRELAPRFVTRPASLKMRVSRTRNRVRANLEKRMAR